MKNLKEFLKEEFNYDMSRLEGLDNDKLFFSEETTQKHIKIIREEFTSLLDNIETHSDIIQLFTVSQGNKKISDFSIISYGLYYLCPNLLNGSCSLSHRCYGAKNERFRSVIKSRLKNYVFFNTLEYYCRDYHTYVYLMDSALELNKSKLTPVIRLNQQSDFKNLEHFAIFDDMLLTIREKYIPNCKFYAYSKNPWKFELLGNHSAEDFIVNRSVVIHNLDDFWKLLDIASENGRKPYYACIMSKDIFKNGADDETLGYGLMKCKNDCSNCRQCSTIFRRANNVKFTYLH